MRLTCALLLAALTAAAAPSGKNPRPPSPRCEGRLTATLEAARINDPNLRDRVECGAGASVLRAQILLDRANYSCGEIDAVYGTNLRRAIAAFQKSWGLEPDGVITAAVWDLLDRDRAQVVGTYTILPEDVAGPFQKIPSDMMAKAELPSLGFQSAAEALAEKFHVSPALLVRLNPGKAFDRASEVIAVPNVLTAPPGKAASIVVSESNRCVCAFDASGRMLSYYPATIGSEHDPLPIGAWKIDGVRFNPVFFYNPLLFWDAAPNHSKAKIAPGPNNPVGVVWIDLSKPHYGIHGTPEPSSIGRRQSHGCIRLTNWDAAELAQMVAPGTPARLEP